LRLDPAAEMRGGVDGDGLKPKHRADRERQPAWQTHADERRGQRQQPAEHDQTQLGP